MKKSFSVLCALVLALMAAVPIQAQPFSDRLADMEGKGIKKVKASIRVA